MLNVFPMISYLHKTSPPCCDTHDDETNADDIDSGFAHVDLVENIKARIKNGH